jgi:hypothetical protein
MGSAAGTVTEAGAIRPIPRADGLISASPPAIGAKNSGNYGKMLADGLVSICCAYLRNDHDMLRHMGRDSLVVVVFKGTSRHDTVVVEQFSC